MKLLFLDNTQYIDLNITLRLVPKERPLLVNETIRCEVVTSLVTTLRQWKGMIFFPRSLLARDILQPRVDKCCNNTLNTGKTTVEEVCDVLLFRLKLSPSHEAKRRPGVSPGRG
jgi:formylmethanofuran dehydrogenase subunit D